MAGTTIRTHPGMNKRRGMEKTMIAGMKKKVFVGFCCLYLLGMSLTACSKHTAAVQVTTPPPDTALVNFQHLNALYIPVSFCQNYFKKILNGFVLQ